MFQLVYKDAQLGFVNTAMLLHDYVSFRSAVTCVLCSAVPQAAFRDFYLRDPFGDMLPLWTFVKEESLETLNNGELPRLRLIPVMRALATGCVSDYLDETIVFDKEELMNEFVHTGKNRFPLVGMVVE